MSLILKVKSVSTGKEIYSYEVELLEYHKEVLENENISLFYFLKDSINEIYESINKKNKIKKGNFKTVFSVNFLDKVLYEDSFDDIILDEEVVTKNEVELFFIFKKCGDSIIKEIAKLHKEMILSSTDNL